jgi:hypothetical protein
MPLAVMPLAAIAAAALGLPGRRGPGQTITGRSLVASTGNDTLSKVSRLPGNPRWPCTTISPFEFVISRSQKVIKQLMTPQPVGTQKEQQR